MGTQRHKPSARPAARRGGPWLLVLLAAACLDPVSPSWAYIGPGTGMVFLSSFLALLLAFVVGSDGCDPQITERLMNEGLLPKLAALVEQGPYRLPLGGRSLELLRKSKPFWEVPGDSEIFSAVMRVPITYPPGRFRGLSLAGLCAPDLLGTQGTFALYTTDADEVRAYGSGRDLDRREGPDVWYSRIGHQQDREVRP